MIKTIAAFLMLLAPLEHLSVTYMRSAYEQATGNEKAARELLSRLSAEQGTIACGYKGAVTMIMAKHVFNPYKKLDWFTSGKDQLEKAISANPQLTELRYLRLTIQCNTPSFLHYNNNIRGDISHIMASLPSIDDKDLRTRMIKFLLACKHITSAERLTLQNTTP